VTVDPQKCTGCGRCESGCPVAGSAIRVYPL
jgi:NAD-dependent dihydropyrimidine dehydrogenase PreA subunit